MRTQMRLRPFGGVFAGLLWFACVLGPAIAEDFKPELLGEPSRISASIQEQNSNGQVQFNGGALGLASEPVWDFGDGTVMASWFPAEHTYASTGSNYLVKVTGRFTDGKTNATELLVRFAPPAVEPIGLPTNLRVTIPGTPVSLASRMPGYGFSETLTAFDETFFSANLPRSVVEYVLSLAASLQCDLVHSNMFLVEGGFRQLVLCDPNVGGMYSIWYSTPVAFGSGNYAFQGTPGYSSFFHEMGHNFTLNFPADYYYGGKTDGNANAIYSETMAQIFQHATAYEILNHALEYGLSPDLVFDIRRSARDSISWVRTSYERYLSSGSNYASWNNPSTPEDETFDTFMTLAYKFFVHAENAGHGYAAPLRRMTRLLGTFDPDLHQRFDPGNNSSSGAAFRATLLVAALSYAFDADLRPEFRDLRFPLDDVAYAELLSRVVPPRLSITAGPSGSLMTLWWAANAPGWELQHGTNLLETANWTTVSSGIANDGSTNTFTLSPDPGQHYYRLKQPD